VLIYETFLKRVLWTFVQAFVAALIAVPVLDLNTAKAAAVVGLTTVLAVVKNFATERVKELEPVESHLKDGDGLVN
jgi:hypothetical protein